MQSQRLSTFVNDNWFKICLYAVLFGALGTLLFWHLSSLTPGYAPIETSTYHASTPVKIIYDNPLNAPFTLVNHALLYLNHYSLFFGRAIAAGLSLITLAVFYFLIRDWHGTRTAMYGTVLFGTSALFLHIGRLGSPMVLSYLLFLLMAAGFWLKQRQSRWAIFFVCFLSALLLYVPGMVIFLVIGAIWQWKVLDAIFKKHLGVVTLGAVLFTAAIAPLAWAMYRNHELITMWLGLPMGPLPDILTIFKNAALVPVHVLLHNSADPAVWLGTAPILDIFTIAMLAVGTITYIRSIALRRTQSLIIFFILMTGLIALGGPITVAVLLPFIYLLVAGGIYHTLHEWLGVFPKNPVARWFGIGLVSVVVLFTATYHLKHYFVGWPQARATTETFVVKQP